MRGLVFCVVVRIVDVNHARIRFPRQSTPKALWIHICANACLRRPICHAARGDVSPLLPVRSTAKNPQPPKPTSGTSKPHARPGRNRHALGSRVGGGSAPESAANRTQNQGTDRERKRR